MTGIEISPLEQVISLMAFRIVENCLSEVDKNDRPCFRVLNLSIEEIQGFLDNWSALTPGTDLEHVKVVISGDSNEKFPQVFRADPNRSITYYRNHIRTDDPWGLVYVQTKTESDEQGLKNLFALRDGNFLDGSFDTEHFKVQDRIVRIAWETCGGNPDSYPTLLGQRLQEVLNSIHPTNIPISVRKYAAFALRACTERLAAASNVDPGETDALVGRSLSELDMFPDEQWRSNSIPARITRRLTLNSLHAELSSGPTTDLDPDALAEVSLKTRFKDEHGDNYQASEQTVWQSKCSQYCKNRSRNLREDIPYRIFEQLFTKDTKGLKLGDRVEQEIRAVAPERAADFEGLNVRDGLNRRAQEDAQRFLDAIGSEAVPLKDLLSGPTRKLVERVAFPTLRAIENPLTKLAEIVGTFRERLDDADAETPLEISLSLGREADIGSPSIGLFAFLYGETLSSIIETSKDEAAGIHLTVDPRLTTVVQPPEVISEGEQDNQNDDGEPADIAWNPVPLEFRLISRADHAERDSELGVEWLPSRIEWIAFFWLLAAADDKPRSDVFLSLPIESKCQEWILEAVGRARRIDAVSFPFARQDNQEIVDRAIDVRNSFIERAGTEGLSQRLLDDTFDKWQLALVDAKREFVPSGTVDNRIGMLLAFDTIRTIDRGTIILPTHPFKLRWLARYLQKSEELAVKALAGELPLNRQNGDLYIEWIANLSSNQQPPIAVDQDRAFLFSAGDIGWSEAFVPILREDGERIAAVVDNLSLDEIARQIIAYLEAHPFKRDGLSLLVVLPMGAALPADLVGAIRRGDWSDTSITVNVLAPQKAWEEITRQFERLPSDNRMSEGEALFPPLQLNLHEFEGAIVEGLLESLRVDIAIMLQFLNNKVAVQQNTEPSVDREGRFDPLLDRSTFVSGRATGGSIAVQMRPKTPDVAFEAWSTLAVRHHRTTPVSQQQPENTDFVELRIDFHETASLFNSLHQMAHWVITLERHITREQIENLESKPEVLVVRDGVGTNGLHKLIVSSNSGRKFIIDRLERKLKALAGNAIVGVPASGINRELATRIYDETRNVAPHLALQATGVSRVTEEILGIMIARHTADAQFPHRIADGLVVWIALDEYPEWFGGAGSTRADFCRITLERINDVLYADILVVEGKLRQAYDQHGVEQVRETLKLFRDMLPREDDRYQPIDVRLWREQILSAMENVNPEAKCAYGKLAEEMDGNLLPASLRVPFRDGQFQVRKIRGLYSLCRHDQTGVRAVEELTEDNVTIVRTYKNHIVDLVTPKQSLGLPTTGAAPQSAEKPPRPASPETVSEITPPVHQVEVAKQSHPESQSSGMEAQPEPSKRRLSVEELGKRYQQILDKFGEFDIAVHAASDPNDRFTEGPATVLYRLRPGQAVDPKRIYEKADALKLALELSEEQNIRFSIDRGFVNLDVPKSERDRYFVSAQEVWGNWKRPSDMLETPIGVDRFGDVVSLNFSSANSPHLLIGGTTGSGKSEALNTILAGLCKFYAPDELKLLLVDPKGTELQTFSGDDHLHGQIGWDDGDAQSLLIEAVEQMQWRYERFKAAKMKSLPEYNSSLPKDQRLPWWVVVLDEYADLTSDTDAKKAIEATLKRLAQKARAAGIHVIIATQKPSAEVISTNLRSNLPAQLALRVKSSTESRVIMDEAGAESLNGKGDAFLRSEGRLTRVQCAKV